MRFKRVFEDHDILVVDKPAGLVVNRSETTRLETLQDQLIDYFKLRDLGIGGRAGIVHRLDRETSGLLVVAKSLKAFVFLQKQFKEREVKKEYLTLVHGHVKDSQGLISASIGRISKFGKFGIVKEGRQSATKYELIKRYKFDDEKFNELIYSLNEVVSDATEPGSHRLSPNNNVGFTKNRINYLKSHAREYALLKIKPLTGRTHQIRVHLKSIGNPVVSDGLYVPSKLLKFDLVWCGRLFLHSASLEFQVKKSKKPLKFELDLPKDLKSAILNLKSVSEVILN